MMRTAPLPTSGCATYCCRARKGGTLTTSPDGEGRCPSSEASVKLKEAGTQSGDSPREEYGTGVSRDWAAKGTMLLGSQAVIAEMFRAHFRSNLIGMGVLPLQFKDGQNAQSSGSPPGNL